MRGYGVNQQTAMLVQQKKEQTLLGKSQLHCYSEIAEQKVPQRKKKQAEEAEEELKVAC